MKKPERVDVGQWYVDGLGGAPFRVTPSTPDFRQRLWLSDAFEYLGSGPNPEPSEWMIETLAEHAWAVCYNERQDQSWTDLLDDSRSMAREAVRKTLNGGATSWPFNSSVLSLYSILRSLGKW